MKKIFLTFLLAVLTLSAKAEYAMDEIVDMALVYQGSTHRPEWTVDELTPYVVHKFADGHTDWFFDGFLFFDFTKNNEIGYGPGYGKNSVRADWEWLLGRVFAKDKGLDALNQCIEKYKNILGDPKFKHKIVLGVPSTVANQKNWGSLNGRELDFSRRDDQMTAIKWYIDNLVENFKKANMDNLELVGFYWIVESAKADMPRLTNDVSDYIHEIGKKFYWIPHWGAVSNTNWKALGFDMAYQQPNHFFDTNVLDSRLNDACRLARSYNMGLELEFDYRVFYESQNSHYSRLETYLKAFEDNAVYEKSSVAYYTGTRALLDMALSEVPENKAIMDRLARHVVERRNRIIFGGIEDATAEKAMPIATYHGIRIVGECQHIEVFTLDGLKISENIESINCPSGIYIVNIDGHSHKVIVK